MDHRKKDADRVETQAGFYTVWKDIAIVFTR